MTLSNITPQAFGRSLATQWASRAEATFLKGKARDRACVEFYAGASAALVAALGETDPLAQAALKHFAMIACLRGHAGIAAIAAPVVKEIATQNDAGL